MPLTRAKSDSIDAGAITSDKIAAGAVTSDKVAAGVGGGPKISSIVYPGDDTAALPAGGQTIIINGSGFVSGCSVIIESAVVGVVTFVSATQLQITAPAKATGTYTLYVVNPDGGTAIRVPGMVYSGTPTWTTASGSLGTPYETNAFSVNFAATGDGSLTYAVTSGSSLPTGLTLTSGGLLSGTVPATANDTTYTFNVDVTDSENQSTTRQFSLTYKTDVITWSSPADGAGFAWDQNTANSTSLVATSAAGKSVSFAVQSGSLPANVTIAGNLITGTPTTIQANTAVTVRATADSTLRYADRILYFTIAEGSSSRGLIMGGLDRISNMSTRSMEYINIASTGNGTNFGDMTVYRKYLGACASSTRGIAAGGYSDNPNAEPVNVIDYVTIASAGNSTNFGALTVFNFSGKKWGIAGCSSSTRGLFAGGRDYNGNISYDVEYITIASLGNSASFGTLSSANSRTLIGSCSSTTRGLFAGGFRGSSIYSSLIEYVTIASTGNGTTFGDLTSSRAWLNGCSSSTRGMFGSGFSSSGQFNSIDYVTIASTGNATYFGDLSVGRYGIAACSSKLRAVYAGTSSGSVAPIDYVTIASTGNATNFGNLSVVRGDTPGGCSNDHGGL